MKKGFYTIGSLLILLIAAFVFVFAGAGFGQQDRSQNVTKMNAFGEEIVYGQNSAFIKAVDSFQRNNEKAISERKNALEQQLLSYGFSKNTKDEEEALSRMVSRQLEQEIYQTVLRQQIIDAASKKAVKDSGWVPSNTEILTALKSDPDFQDNTGKYNATLYNNKVDSEPDFVQEKRDFTNERLYAARYQMDILSARGSDAEAQFINSLNGKNNKRVFKMAKFSYADYPDSEKIAYGKENLEKFIRYDLSVLTFQSYDKASETLSKINNKEMTFEDAIKESENTYGNNGKYANKYNYLITKTLSSDADKNAVFNLKQGEISGVISTEGQYSIFRADSNPEKPDFTNKDLIKTIGNYINSEHFALVEEYFTKKAKAFADDAKDRGFNSACAKAGVKSVDLPAFPLNYMGTSFMETVDSSTDGMAGADGNENLLRTIFALQKNEVSAPVVNGRNILVFQYTKDGADPEKVPEKEAVLYNAARVDSSLIEQNILNSGSVAEDASNFIQSLFKD